MNASSPITYTELKARTFPEPLYLLMPWLQEQTLSMVHSWRGVGKTWFALAVYQAIASGSAFLKWATNPAPVFYFDCEMGMRLMKKRYGLVDDSAAFRAPGAAVEFFTYEHMGGYTWNLADVKNQIALNKLLTHAKLLVIDNLSAAVRPIGREDYKAAFYRFRDWLIALKSSGRSVLIVHHSGKEGKQRGISDIEDPLDVVINLRRAEDWQPTHGTQFELHFEKGRNLEPADQDPLFVEMNIHADGLKWLYTPLVEIENKRKEKRRETVINWEGDNDRELF